jgi:hypothetical protein
MKAQNPVGTPMGGAKDMQGHAAAAALRVAPETSVALAVLE